VVFLSFTGLMIPVYMLAMTVNDRLRRATGELWFAVCCELTGLQIKVRNLPAADRQVVFACNHVSYLDIPVLGFLFDAVFVAKSEVASWPLFGIIARLGRTVFVNRDPRHSKKQSADIRARLAQGASLVLFPEGTSSNGHAVLPFKSALFDALKAAGDDRPVWVQPVSISYVRTAGGRTLRHGLEDAYAWHGDMTLAPHLFRVLCLRGAVVDVTFHDPINPSRFAGRKDLANACHNQVAEGVRDAQLREAYRVFRRISD
jgi:1-acyl-sn-glycerol-3-phosphate acyltransferase